MSFRIVPREKWTDRQVRLSKMVVPAPYVFIHHTADGGPSGGSKATVAAEKAYMRSIESYHVNSRSMSAIAYSFVVVPSGRIYAGRGWGKQGGHTYGYNSSSHAICFAGNFDTMRPTKAALDAARWLVKVGTERGQITGKLNLRGHRDVGDTACPGKNLYAQLAYLRTPYVEKVRVTGRVRGAVEKEKLGALRRAFRRLKRRFGLGGKLTRR